MRLALAAALLMISGCFGPDVAGVRCGPEGLCPTGNVCDPATMTCRAPGPGDSDASPPDAPPVESDRDDDGVADDDDNCPDDSNPAQADEDLDQRGDLCDNCPGTANTDQADDGETAAGATADGVGDACDPRPQGGGDSIAVFEPFDDLDAWTSTEGTDTWTASSGQAVQPEASSGVRHLLLVAGPFDQVAVRTRFTALEVPGNGGGDTFRSGGVLALHDPNSGSEGRGYGCTFFFDAGAAGNGTELMILRMGAATLPISRTGSAALVTGETYEIAMTADSVANSQACTGETGGVTDTVESGDGNIDSGAIGIRTNGISATFDFVTVFSLGN